MEGKKSVAVLAASLLIVLLLLSGQPPPVSGLCWDECLETCYSFCRESDHQPRFVCKVRCTLFNFPCLWHHDSEEVAAASSFAGEGSGSKEKDHLQSASVRGGAAAIGGGNDVAACVHGYDNRRLKTKRD